jgi:hypothetical protein
MSYYQVNSSGMASLYTGVLGLRPVMKGDLRCELIEGATIEFRKGSDGGLLATEQTI